MWLLLIFIWNNPFQLPTLWSRTSFASMIWTGAVISEERVLQCSWNINMFISSRVFTLPYVNHKHWRIICFVAPSTFLSVWFISCSMILHWAHTKHVGHFTTASKKIFWVIFFPRPMSSLFSKEQRTYTVGIWEQPFSRS